MIPTRMRLLLGKEREIGILTIISIIVCSNGLLFYVQNITADDLKKSVFEQQKQTSDTIYTRHRSTHRLRYQPCYVDALWFGKLTLCTARRTRG